MCNGVLTALSTEVNEDHGVKCRDLTTASAAVGLSSRSVEEQPTGSRHSSLQEVDMVGVPLTSGKS